MRAFLHFFFELVNQAKQLATYDPHIYIVFGFTNDSILSKMVIRHHEPNPLCL